MHLVNMLTEADSKLKRGGGSRSPVPDNHRALDHLHNLYSVHHADSSLLTDDRLYQNARMYSFDNETFWISSLFVGCVLKSTIHA